MTAIWKVEDLLEDAFDAVISAASISGLSTCKTFTDKLPSMPYCAILALDSDKLIPDANYGDCENRSVTVTLRISGHSQDMTRDQYAELVGNVMDSIYTDTVVSDLNTAASGITIQRIEFGKINRGVTDHSFDTTIQIMVDVFPSTET